MPDLTKSATANASGLATVTIQTDSSRPWSIKQVSNECLTAPGGATCVLRKNGALVTPLVAQGDAADGTPVEITPFEALTVEWDGLTPGTVAHVFVIYEVV